MSLLTPHIVHKWGLAESPTCDCGHEPYCRHMSIDKIWRWIATTIRGQRRCRQVAGICSDYITRDIKVKTGSPDRLFYC